MRIPFIPLYLALSTLVFSQMVMADEVTTTAASVQNVAYEKPSASTGEISETDVTKSPRCMINPRGEGCTKELDSSQLALGLDLSIATQGAGGLYNPEADINAMHAYAGLNPANVN